MTVMRRVAPVVFGLATALSASASSAAELVYGSWPPASEYLNRVTLPKVFADIAKQTNGAITWKLVPGGQLADGRATFQAASDGLITAGLGIVTYAPNTTVPGNPIEGVKLLDGMTHDGSQYLQPNSRDFFAFTADAKLATPTTTTPTTKPKK